MSLGIGLHFVYQVWLQLKYNLVDVWYCILFSLEVVFYQRPGME